MAGRRLPQTDQVGFVDTLHRPGDDLHERRPRRVQDGRGEDQREGGVLGRKITW